MSVDIAINYHGPGECGCKIYEVSFGTNNPCNKDLTFQLEKKNTGFWSFLNPWSHVRQVGSLHPDGGGADIEFTFQLCPEDPSGDYRVVARCDENGLWGWKKRASNTFNFTPADFCVELETVLTNGTDKTIGEYDTGSWDCDSPLILRVQHHRCWKRYMIRIRRHTGGGEIGPSVQTAWAPAPPSSTTWDLRMLAASLGWDFVPGQCYKVNLFAQAGICPDKTWNSVGHVFCIDCCCD